MKILTSTLPIWICLAGCSGQNPATAPGQSGKPAAQTVWVSFQDPAEQAFTIDVPKGWGVKGGLYRLGYSDYRPMVEITSPDGRVSVRYGDVGIPPYATPDRTHAEGTPYILDGQAQMTIARFRPGDEYARMYARARFQSVCQKAEVQQSGPAPFRAASIPQNDVVKESEGQITLRCTSKGGVLTGFAYTKTILHQGNQIWTVTSAVSFLSPPQQESVTRDLASRFAQSFRLSPAWVQYQVEQERKGVEYAQALARHKIAVLSQEVQQFHTRMQAMSNQVAGFEGRMNSQAAQVQGFTDVLSGITRTTDPLTGEHLQVSTGQSSQYWRNGLGDVISSPTSPGPSFHPINNDSH